MKGKISRQRTASLAGAEESAVQSSLVQSEVSTQDSAEVSVSSETESKAEESVTAEKSSGIKAGKSSEPKTEDTSTEDKTSTTDVGAGEISIKEASSDNTQLSFGNFIVTIGNKTVTLSGAYVVDGIDAVIDGAVGLSDQVVQVVVLCRGQAVGAVIHHAQQIAVALRDDKLVLFRVPVNLDEPAAGDHVGVLLFGCCEAQFHELGMEEVIRVEE